MDHEQIDQFNLVDRYLMGRLPAEESLGFEEHLVDCPQCIVRLQTTNRFLQGLRQAAAEQALQIEYTRPRRTTRHFLQTLFHKPLAWAAVGLFIAALAAFFVVDYTRRLRTDVEQAKSLSEQWQRRYDDERQAALAADRKRQETESQLIEQRRVLESKLQDEQAQRAKMAAEFSRWMRPEGGLPIFVLTSVRGRETNAAETGNKIILPRSVAMFAFSIPLEGEVSYESYRMTIIDHRHRPVWKRGGLAPDRYNSLSVGFKSGFFQPGAYSLIVEGIKKEGVRDEAGNYPFLIIKTR
jgi:hypothetical protein